MKCKICEVVCKNNVGLSSHLRTKHSLTILNYYKEHDISKLKYCKYCGNICKIQGGNFRETCCSKKCIGKVNELPHSEKTKELLRQKRFDYLSKKTGKTAWERRQSGQMSSLEKWFFDDIIYKYKLYEIYDIVN